MGAAHRSTRPKGFLTVTDKRSSNPNEWCPKPEAWDLIDQVKEIIDSSRFRGGKSVRFIFYRMVGNYGYPKTEQAYNNLAELLVKARRAQLISFRAIVDNGTDQAGGIAGYASRAEYLRDSKEDLVEGFSLDEMREQPFHIELWSEDSGSVSMMAQIVRDYPVTVYSTGGFSSVTVTHQIAQRVAGRDRPTMFLHVGDYDPSGESIFKSMSQDIGAFVVRLNGGEWNPDTGRTYLSEDDDGPDFRPLRVALTEDQAIEWGLETAPPKRSDSRTPNWVAQQSGALGGEMVQVQAMTEDQMEETVLKVVRDYVDEDILEETRVMGSELREEMAPLIESAFNDVIDELGEER